MEIYNLNVKDSNSFSSFYEKGKIIFNDRKFKTRNNLKSLTCDGIIDGNNLQKDWFPEQSVDIFISHSHSDEKLAIGLAGRIESETGLKCFVDSCVWGNSQELLSSLSNYYKDKDGLNDFKKTINASHHVDMILTTALIKMIFKSKIIIFLNTENSTSLKYSDLHKDISTFSPWIFTELEIANLLYSQDKRLKFTYEEVNESLKINYKVPTNNFIPLSASDIIAWTDYFTCYNSKNLSALNILKNKIYKIN